MDPETSCHLQISTLHFRPATPQPLTYLLLVFPAGTAVSRMVLNRHWFTDVLTGAVLGSVIGITLAKWHKDMASEKGFYDPHETPPTLVSFTIQL